MEPHTGKSLFLYGLKRPASFFDHYETRQKLHPPLERQGLCHTCVLPQSTTPPIGRSKSRQPFNGSAYSRIRGEWGEALLNVPTNDPEACGWDA